MVLVVCRRLIITFITQRAHECDMVLVHDDDLERISGITSSEGSVSGYFIFILSSSHVGSHLFLLNQKW